MTKKTPIDIPATEIRPEQTPAGQTEAQEAGASETQVPREANASETQASQEEAAAAPEVVQLTKAEFETVKTHIEGLQKEKDEAIALAQRYKADFENYRRRNESVSKDSYQEGVRDCVKALLPSLDSLDLALQNTANIDPCFADGVRLVQRQLVDALKKQGMQELPSEGVFDPNLHNAVLQEPAQGKEKGEILEVLQKGYEVNGRIVRHSMVKVAE